MNKDIRYNGYTTAPSDYECPDGELSASVNLIAEDGELKPVPASETILALLPMQKLLLVHQTDNGSNFIIAHGDINQDFDLLWLHKTADKTIHPQSSENSVKIGSFSGFVDIKALGNIILLSLSSSLIYIRYIPQEDSYIVLGDSIPDINIDFALRLNFVSERYEAPLIKIKSPDYWDKTTDDSWKLLYAHELTPVKLIPIYIGTEKYFYTDAVALDPDIVLKKGVEYKFSFRWPQKNRQGFNIALLGIDPEEDNTGESKFHRVPAVSPISSPLGSSLELRVIPEHDWENIHFLAYTGLLSTDRPSYNIPIIVNLFTGIESDSDSSYTVLYDRDSHLEVSATINKFINQKATRRNRFVFPFFVRYAVRLFDGSYVRTSPPCLMIPNSGFAPALFFYYDNDQNYLCPSAFIADLMFRVNDMIPPQWEDIISAIDIFISPQVFPFRQGEEYDSLDSPFRFTSSVDSFGLGSPCLEQSGKTDDNLYFSYTSLNDYILRFTQASMSFPKKGFLQFAPKASDEIMADLRNQSSFYRLASIDISELKESSFSDFSPIPGVPDESLSVIHNQPLLDLKS